MLYEKVLIRKTVNKAHLNLKKNVYSLLANLAINQKHRFNLVEQYNEKDLSSETEDSRWAELVK